RRLIAESDDVPDPLLHELRAAADLAERNGLPIDLVTIGAPPPLPVEVRRRLADPLTATLADARGWARLTVVCGPDEVAVSLVTPDRVDPDPAGPPPDDGRRDADDGGSVADDGGWDADGGRDAGGGGSVAGGGGWDADGGWVAEGGGSVEHLYERDGEIRWTQTRWRR
ncbi:hypothetical protein ACWENR_15765, partial [Micromonospora sp. NPDC004336]